MSIIRPPSNVSPLDSSGLSDDEREAIHDVAYGLMADGRSLGVGEEEDDGAKNVFLLDIHGNRYTIARNVGAYLLLDPAFGIIAIGSRFDDVIEELRSCL